MHDFVLSIVGLEIQSSDCLSLNYCILHENTLKSMIFIMIDLREL